MTNLLIDENIYDNISIALFRLKEIKSDLKKNYLNDNEKQELLDSLASVNDLLIDLYFNDGDRMGRKTIPWDE